jgi:hypothetical protein
MPSLDKGQSRSRGLQFGRVRRQKDEMQSFWKDELRTAMPPCPIKHNHKLFGRTSADAFGKVLQGQVHHLDIDPWQEQPNGVSRLRMHEAAHVHPLIACLHDDTRTRSFSHPDAAEQRLEANAMLIEGPEFDTGLRMGLLDLS